MSAGNHFQTYLASIGACREAREWAGERSAQQAWDECDRADWLLWWAAKTGTVPKVLVRLACRFAREALGFVKKGELRPLRAIEAAEAWCEGKATIEEVREARRTAADAAYAAKAAYAAAAAAAAAAAYAANADAYAAYAAAYAAANAAAAADAAAAANAAADAAAAANAAAAAAAYAAAAAAADAAAAYAAAAAAAAYAAAAARHSKQWRQTRAAKLQEFARMVREEISCPVCEEVQQWVMD